MGGEPFPLGTLAVNITGCFLIGALSQHYMSIQTSPQTACCADNGVLRRLHNVLRVQPGDRRTARRRRVLEGRGVHSAERGRLDCRNTSPAWRRYRAAALTD